MSVFKWVTTHRLRKFAILRYVCLAFPNVLKSEEADMIHSRANQLTHERDRTHGKVRMLFLLGPPFLGVASPIARPLCGI